MKPTKNNTFVKENHTGTGPDFENSKREFIIE